MNWVKIEARKPRTGQKVVIKTLTQDIKCVYDNDYGFCINWWSGREILNDVARYWIDMDEYEKQHVFEKPPLGLVPRYITDEQRVEDIIGAIQRHIDTGYPINIEWIEEYNELVKRIRSLQKTMNKIAENNDCYKV